MSKNKQRIAAMKAIATIPDKQDERAVKSYIESLEMAMNAAFNLLAQDKHYSPNTNAAYTILGRFLGKVSNKQEPFEDDVAKYP